MPRVVSFIVLVTISLLTGLLLFRVMAQFVVPLFLATLLVVMFRPLHDWFIDLCKGRNRLAAGLTTLAILLVVLLPVAWILFRAISEAVVVTQTLQQDPPDWAAMIRKTTVWVRAHLEPLQIALPDDEALLQTAEQHIEDLLAPAAFGGVQFALQMLVRLIVGLAIMVVSLYYFLADGPAMIQTVMRLSPLDDRYEHQLLQEFTRISRAVVVAALLAAGIQGILAGIGFYFAGLSMIFLLMVLTSVLALVPFVGAAAVWIPCCLWLYVSGRPVAAVLLTAYCGLMVSTADNIIKPLVLHGQSGIHPLMALLSILGGVAVLGPIGIVVGPMLVAFLQALLNMVRAEMVGLDKSTLEG